MLSAAVLGASCCGSHNSTDTARSDISVLQRCLVQNLICHAIRCTKAVNGTSNSTDQDASQECPVIASAPFRHCLTAKPRNVTSGHRSDEVATEHTEMSPEPSALLSNHNLSDVGSSVSFEQILNISDFAIRHKYPLTVETHLLIHELSRLEDVEKVFRMRRDPLGEHV